MVTQQSCKLETVQTNRGTKTMSITIAGIIWTLNNDKEWVKQMIIREQAATMQSDGIHYHGDPYYTNKKFCIE